MTSHYDIKGIPVKGGDIPVRSEFSTWATNPESNIQVSLMIRALQRFYQVPITDTKSYFQIAGIHGYPANSWDGSPDPAEIKEENGKPILVYCTHSTIRFPTWHRPYMLLFEQRLHELMLEGIDTLEFKLPGEKDEWVAEAYKWRLPYWDWARNPHIPELFKSPNIKIRVPRAGDGSLPASESIANPLWRYECLVDGKPTPMGELPDPYKIKNIRFDEGPDDYYPWKECSGTSRWSIGHPKIDWKAGFNNWEGTNLALEAHEYYIPGKDNPPIPGKESISDLVYRMMTKDYFRSWRKFSTTKYIPEKTNDWTSYLSLEYIHNNLHGFIGGGDNRAQGFGHMEDVPVAAFDPIFYFHHCNIDRQIAIWQTLNWSKWFDDPDTEDIKNPKSSDPLYPFWHRDENDKWKAYSSDDIREWTPLGYQYDILARQPDEINDDVKYLQRIAEYVDSYKNTSKSIFKAKPGLFGDSNKGEDVYPDYIVDVLYDRHGYNGYPYYIYFFLGNIADAEVVNSETLIAAHPRHVGTIYTFTNSYKEGDCANCDKQKAEGDLCTAQIPLTSTLIKHATDDAIPQFNNINHHSVTTYLKENLTWKAVSVNGQIIPAAKLPQTTVYVLHGKGQHFKEPWKLSQYSEYQLLHKATEGKDWGATPDKH